MMPTFLQIFQSISTSKQESVSAINDVCMPLMSIILRYLDHIRFDTTYGTQLISMWHKSVYK
jgi:hypothetical protein